MSSVPLKDILISARQEAHRMRHFYLGVEHLFVALLEIKGGIASSILDDYGIPTDYVIDAVRRKTGKGSRHRLWAGIPNTPRADVVLGIAAEIALDSGRKSIVERDVLIALLDEGDNVPIRVLEALGIGLEQLREDVLTKKPSSETTHTFVQVDFGPGFSATGEALTKDQLFVLRRMFQEYPQIRIDNRLTGGYTPALILVVTPIHEDTREDAAVVVKIGQVDTIMEEAQRYETYVKGKLPPLTARLEDKPTAPETSDLAAIRYTLVADTDQIPQDLRVVVQQWGGPKTGEWIKEKLFPTFGRIWWQQNRPYRFEAWREYDWLLPPILTLEVIPDEKYPEDAHTLRAPIRRSKLGEIQYGDAVIVENFIVKKVDREHRSIQLGFGQSPQNLLANKIEIRGIDFDKDTYYRGEVVEQIAGRVWKTRGEQLLRAARDLEPDFDIEAEKIPFGDMGLPNPLHHYQEILDDYYINGSMSTIHGDLHLGNIMLGPSESPSLIDFAQTRDGHTCFDWATLELSLLSDLVMPLVGSNWSDARKALMIVASMNDTQPSPTNDPVLGGASEAVNMLRSVARECLSNPNNWAEYHLALAMAALRAITWNTMAVGGRRLMFLIAALSIYELKYRPYSGDSGTPSPDETDSLIL